MGFLNIIAPIAGKMPYVVWKARFFKRFQRLPRLKGDISKFNSLAQYVVDHGLKNRHNERWGIMADKYAVRTEIDRLLGQGHLIPLLGRWENPDDIDFDSLPESFILKTNNGCGTNIFVHDKNDIDRQEIIRKLRKSLKFPYPQLTGQLHYAMIPPCVIAEEIIVQDGGHSSLTDYKIHCVNGEPVTFYVFTDRDETHHFDFTLKAYTAKWREMPPGTTPADVENNPEAPDKPAWFDEMIDMARKLSAGEEYVRVDFYCVNGNILFGEMTFTPDTAFHKCYEPYQGAMRYVLDCIRIARQSNR